MNLSKLFDMQRELDKKIIEEKNIGDMDRLPYLILALQVELGECANEWRGFKYWSKDRESRSLIHRNCSEKEAEYFECGICHKKYDPLIASVNDYECGPCNNVLIGFNTVNPLLEEYVDCLHFILSIGNELGFQNELKFENIHEDIVDTLEAFSHSFNWISSLDYAISNYGFDVQKKAYQRLIDVFLALGFYLYFPWPQVEQAYISKNKVNHQRQDNGY